MQLPVVVLLLSSHLCYIPISRFPFQPLSSCLLEFSFPSSFSLIILFQLLFHFSSPSSPFHFPFLRLSSSYPCPLSSPIHPSLFLFSFRLFFPFLQVIPIVLFPLPSPPFLPYPLLPPPRRTTCRSSRRRLCLANTFIRQFQPSLDHTALLPPIASRRRCRFNRARYTIASSSQELEKIDSVRTQSEHNLLACSRQRLDRYI